MISGTGDLTTFVPHVAKGAIAATSNGGQLGAACQARLRVDRARLLADGALAHAAQLGDLLQAQALEQQQAHFALGGGEAPAFELLVDRSGQPGQRVRRLLAPARGLSAGQVEIALGLAAGLHGRGAVPPGPAPGPGRAAQGRQRRRALQQQVAQVRAVGAVLQQVGADTHGDEQEEQPHPRHRRFVGCLERLRKKAGHHGYDIGRMGACP